MPKAKVKVIQRLDINSITGLLYVTHVNVQVMTSKARRCAHPSLGELVGVFISEKGMWRWRVRVQAKSAIMFSRGPIIQVGI
jgi:hypothetical protein